MWMFYVCGIGPQGVCASSRVTRPAVPGRNVNYPENGREMCENDFAVPRAITSPTWTGSRRVFTAVAKR